MGFISIATLVISGVDMILTGLISLFGLCMSGHCKSSCCSCISFEHDEDDENNKKFEFSLTETTIEKLKK